jgi:hypothetical protein
LIKYANSGIAMSTNLPVQPSGDSLPDKVVSWQRAWKRLGESVRSITPQAIGRALLVLGALAGAVWLAVASEPKPSTTDTLRGFTRRFRLPFRRGVQNTSPEIFPVADIERSVG